MNKTKQSAPFFAKLKPSKQLQYLNIAVHISAWIACFANALPLTIQILIGGLIAINFGLKRQHLKAEPGTLSYSEDKGWQYINKHEFEKIQIKTTTVISTFLIFLHFTNRPTILIAHDALSEEDYRQLIVKLRMTVKNDTEQH